MVDGRVFCGAGGWLCPQDPYFEPLDRKSYERELAAWQEALRAGTALAGDGPLHALLHFPPCTSQGRPTPFDEAMRQHAVKSVTFGHFHLEEEWAVTPRGTIEGIHYTLASCDYLNFKPVRLPI